MNKYKIAGLVLQLDWSKEMIHNNFESFACSDSEPTDLLFQLEVETVKVEPTKDPIIHSSYLTVYDTEEGFLLMYPTSLNLNASLYNKANKSATLYLTNELTKNAATKVTNTVEGIELNTLDYIFFAIRDLFFIHMQQHHILAVHSSSIIYRDKAYLFSACSGTGKTTHTNLWVERFGVEILDGDVAAVTIEDGQAIAYGLPWCGTSNRFVNRRMVLGGIIFLAQSCHNSLSRLTPFEATLRLAARCFTPTWTKEQSEINLFVAEEIAPKILTAYLGCLPNQEAVDMIKELIDAQ